MMIAIISLWVVVTLSILITRIASIALSHTGLSHEAARFQARSAFTGAGFTTNESERVVAHPVRRRIIMMLMLVGNAGIVTAISSLILTFVHQGESEWSLTTKVALLVVGLAVLWTFATSEMVDRYLSRFIDGALKKYTRLDVRDYSSLMRLGGEYRLVELGIEAEDWLAGKTLTEAKLRDEGIVVLGVRRQDGTYLGAPHGPTKVMSNDTLLLYGRISALEELDCRRRTVTGDREHEEAVAQQAEVVATETKQDLGSSESR